MHKTKVFSTVFIFYLCFVVWVVLLSREPSEEAIIKLFNKKLVKLKAELH